MELATLFVSLNQVVTIGKTMVEIRDRTVHGSTVIEFQNAIMSVQQQAMALLEEQQRLLNRVHELEDECKAYRNIPGVTYEKPYYWRTLEGQKDGPYCQFCHDKDKRLVRLQGDGCGWWQCQECKAQVTDEEASIFLDTNLGIESFLNENP